MHWRFRISMFQYILFLFSWVKWKTNLSCANSIFFFGSLINEWYNLISNESSFFFFSKFYINLLENGIFFMPIFLLHRKQFQKLNNKHAKILKKNKLALNICNYFFYCHSERHYLFMIDVVFFLFLSILILDVERNENVHW